MCINESMVITLRALINDLDATTYSDERLEQLIAVAANFVLQDTQSTVYTVNIMSPDITPDPVTSRDIYFTNLSVVKAACMIDQGNLRVRAAMAGLEALAGPTRLKVGGEGFSAYKEIIALGPCEMYKRMLEDYILGTGLVCHGILSPFVSNDYYPDFGDEGEYR